MFYESCRRDVWQLLTDNVEDFFFLDSLLEMRSFFYVLKCAFVKLQKIGKILSNLGKLRINFYSEYKFKVQQYEHFSV